MKKKDISMNCLTPLMEEVLRSGGTVELTTTGNSMRPMLLHRVSKVRLAPPGELKRGDIPLYRRDTGAYVLHRIVGWDGATYTLCGDNQWQLETGIRPDQILAVTEAFCRRDRWVSCGNGLYGTYWRFWVMIRPVRRLIIGGGRRLKKMAAEIFR